MATIQKLIKLLFLFCFISTWYSCENNEIYPEKVSIPAEITNRSAILLLEQLQENNNIYQEFQSTLSGNQPRYDLVQIITHSDFGLCYYIPYSQTANSKITGAIYLPAGATLAENGQVALDGTLRTPVNMNAHTINHEVNITQRFLYSVPFKKLQEQGVEVEPELTIYADSLNNKVIPLAPEEYSFPNTLQSRASVDMIRINISYSSDYIGNQTDAIIGLSPETLKQIIYKSLIQMGINYIRLDDIKHDFQMMRVQFPVSYISINIPDFLGRLMQVIRNNALAKGFDLILQYQYDIKHEYSSGSSSSESGTGGSSSSGGGDSSTSSPKVPEEDSSTLAKSIQRKVPRLWNLLSNIKAAVVGTNTYITFQDYLTAVNSDPQNEHSTTLIDYGTEQYLTEVIHGTENGVFNNVSSEYVTAEIHNHPDGTPPSAQDLLFTAEMIHTEQDYQATFVYNHDDGSYYSLYVHDAQQAQSLYNSIQNEIDPVTNDFKKNGECYNLLSDYRKTFNRLSAEQQQIYKLCIIIAEYGGNGIAVTKYDSKNARTEVYSVTAQTGSDGKKFYTPLICK